jgi:hypothetical protein
MPLTDGTLNSLGTHLAGLITHVSLHTAAPGSTGANESTAARLPVTWTVDADGDLTTTQKNFTGGAANGPVHSTGYWSAITGGTFRGSDPVTGDTTFNAAGEYSATPTINGTST